MSKVTVLLVEDNPDDAELALRALHKQQLLNDIIHVEDGAEALDFMYGQGKHQHRDLAKQPKLILLDLKLPKIDGLEVLAKLKSDPRFRHIPIVILTSSREDTDVGRAYYLGANSYIVKPVEFELFLTTVAEIGYYWVLLNQTAKTKTHP